MKVMVYTYAVLGMPKQHSMCKEKEDQLKERFPGINIMVIPGPGCEGDKVHMIDMTPNYYPQFGGILAGTPTTTVTPCGPTWTATNGGWGTVGTVLAPWSVQQQSKSGGTGGGGETEWPKTG